MDKYIDISKVTVDILSEFLEVAIHSILYVRHIYPSGIFVRRKKYNVPVQVSCHPGVTTYIQDTVTSLRPLISSGELEKVVIVISNSKHQPMERFVFEIAPVTSPSLDNDSYLLRLEQSLRAFMLKLNVCEAMLSPLPKDCSWSMQIHTKESAAEYLQNPASLQDFSWVEADKQQTSLADPQLVPIKATSTDIIQMQLYAEETSLKNTS